MHGGWIGVEVFFVVSGFLITSLLLDEREASGRTDLGRFWLRRARRLLPALAVVLAAVAVVTLAVGSAAERGDMRRDLPWALGYLGNWGQIVGDVPYYAGDPPLLRHLWSLAIEEQFYLLWPLAFVALARSRLTTVAIARLLGGVAVALMVWTFWLHAGGPGLVDLFGGVDRVNFMYLSTFTRADRPPPRRRRRLRLAPLASPSECSEPSECVAHACRMPDTPMTRHSDGSAGGARRAGVHRRRGDVDGRLRLPVAAAAGDGAGPGGRARRRAPGGRRDAARSSGGRRSSPSAAAATACTCGTGRCSCSLGATHGDVRRVAIALAVTVVASELSYRYVETAGPPRRARRLVADAPARPAAARCCGRGRRGRRRRLLRRGRPLRPGRGRRRRRVRGARRRRPPSVAAPAAPTLPRRRGRSSATRRPTRSPSTSPTASSRRSPSPTARSTAAASTTPAASTAPAQASATPSRSAPAGRRRGPAPPSRPTPRSPSSCSGRGTCSTWRPATAGASRSARRRGTTTCAPTCRPGSTRSSGPARRWRCSRCRACARSRPRAPASRRCPSAATTPASPTSTSCSARVAATSGGTVTFVEGPDAWCADEAVANDVGMRWDGVHVYKPGAKLIYDTIAPTLRRACRRPVCPRGDRG